MEEKEKDVIAEQEKEEPVLEEAVESNPPEPAGEEEESSALKQLTEEKQAVEDRLLRLSAEFDNYRKRTQREKDGTYQLAVANTVAQFLGVLDNLERALDASDGTDFAKGVEMTLNQFKKVLEDIGIETINPVGEPFDPNVCNAVAHVESEDFAENTVSAVFQKGYKLGDRILRPAMVQVAN